MNAMTFQKRSGGIDNAKSFVEINLNDFLMMYKRCCYIMYVFLVNVIFFKKMSKVWYLKIYLILREKQKIKIF